MVLVGVNWSFSWGSRAFPVSPVEWKNDNKYGEIQLLCFFLLLLLNRKIMPEKAGTVHYFWLYEIEAGKQGTFLSRRPWRVGESLKLTETFWHQENMWAHWSSEMFLKNLLMLAGSFGGGCLHRIKKVGSLFSLKATLAKGKQILFLGSAWEMFVMLTKGSQ